MVQGKLDSTGAPKLRARLDSGSGRFKEVDALLDTGAAQCLITQEMASELELVQRGKAKLGSAHRETVEPVYYVFLTIPDLYHGTVAAIEMKPNYDFFLIGRDVLGKMRLVYDGPAGIFEITLAQP